MIRFIMSCFLFLLTFHNYAEIPQEFFSETDAFLKKHVYNGLVDYKSIKKDPRDLEAIYQQVGQVDLSNESDLRKKAFYINAYNIAVIYSIVKYYPLKSPLDRPGFFDKEKHKIAGEEITLDILEKKKLIGAYADPRFHFVLVCAAKSCPPLRSEVFIPDKLEQQLNTATTSTLNDNSFIKVYTKQKKIELSKIFEWYKADYVSGELSVVEWINQYRKEKIPNNYTVGYYEYDWTLNEK